MLNSIVWVNNYIGFNELGWNSFFKKKKGLYRIVFIIDLLLTSWDLQLKQWVCNVF